MMDSAIGNFDSNGVAVKAPQTPENGYSPHNVEWCASKIVALEDEIARLKSTVILEKITSETTNDVLNVLEYVTKDEWDHFTGLAICMLANGATLFELQQRLMGL